jgi:hypothetical protein
VAPRDRKPDSERADYLTDFPEEFEQRPDAPPRDQARRAQPGKRASDEALARIDAMKRRVDELARKEREKDEG